MELLKLAIKYYIKVSGKTCNEFYADLKKVCETDIKKQSGDAWLRHKLVEQVINYGCNLETILNSQDLMLNYFVVKYESDIQEYSVEPAWGKELFKFLEQHGVDVENTIFWDIHSLSDSLFPTKIKQNNVYMSHSNADMVKNIVTKKGTPFVFDFLQSDDISTIPNGLKDAIEQNKSIVLLCCLPIRKDSIKNDISNRMYNDGFTLQNDDIHYMYLYRLMEFVQKYNLTNCRIGFFGDTALYTEDENKSFRQKFRSIFDFIDGFCFSLRDFNSTLLNVTSLHFSLWQVGENQDKPILLLKKRLATKTKIVDGEHILFGEKRASLLEWLKPTDVLFYKNAPVMLNYATFKGGEKFEKVARHSGKMAENALGTLAISDEMKNVGKVQLLSGVPSNSHYVDITEENFWRCVAAFAYNLLESVNWSNKAEILSAPNTTVDGYDTWCKNAILLFLFDKKSMFSNLRNIEWENSTYTVENKMFFVDKQIMEMSTTDNLLKQQIHNAKYNDVVMRMIVQARPLWVKETTQLYEFVLDFVQRTLDQRANKRYAEDTDSWNAGFSQLVSVFGEEDMLFRANFTKLFQAYKNYLSKDVKKFGFSQDR